MSSLTICCDPTSVFLFWLAMRAGRAIDGRAAMGARKAAALAKGRRKRAFMVGYLEFGTSARCCGGSIGRLTVCERGIDALDDVFGARRDER
jgi:hypothetical protein